MIYNGIDLLSVHAALSINKEIPPGAAARNLTSVAGLDGERFAGAAIQQDEYKLRVNIAGRSRREAWEVRALLAAWAYSSDRPAELIPTNWPSVHYMAVCKEVSPPEFTFGFGTVTISFALMRPIAIDNVLSRAAGSKSAVMAITGSAPARPVIRQKLDAAASRVTISLDGKPFMVLVPSAAYPAGSAIEIDTAARSLTVDGVHRETDIDYAASIWRPGFVKGAHTVASSAAGRVEIEWRNEWY